MLNDKLLRKVSEIEESEKNNEEGGEKLNVIQKKRVISPNIQRMSEVFEKKDKLAPKDMSRGENVRKLRSSFEVMMNETKTRKTSFEVKQRKTKNEKNKNKSDSLKETPCRTILDMWVGREED